MNQQLISMAFSNYYRKEVFTLEEALHFLGDRNLINVGELAEVAIQRKGKLKKNARNTKGSDFNDNSESKYVTVSHYKTKQGSLASYASIAGLRNKIGTLRVMVYEPLTDVNYFFRIPHRVYAPYTDVDDSLKIWFDSNGDPRVPTRSNIRYNLWDYECSQAEYVS
jgi:hypothetical protein